MPEETAPADKPALIARTRRERGRLDDAIGALPPARLTEPAFNDGWSVKDALAHVTAWEQRCLGWIEASLRGEDPADRREFAAAADDEQKRAAVVHGFNARVYSQNRTRPLDDVLAAYRRSFAELMRTLDSLSDDDLFNGQRFPWTGGHPLAAFVRGNADEHYAEHARQIEALARDHQHDA